MGSDPEAHPLLGDASRPVVVVHGLWMPGPETILLRRRLARAGFAPCVFHYRSLSARLDEAAAALAEHVDALRAPGVDFVGYSLGGIVVLTMLTRLKPDHEGRVVCLGSPLKASLAAGRLRQLPGGGRILGVAMRELIEHGGFDAWRGGQALGIVAGDLPLSFGRLLGRLPEANDGTVMVAETRLEGAADHIVVRASHPALMFSRRVADETIHFLRRGAFSASARREARAASASS